MENVYLLVDIDRCWGCKSCQVACKREHGLSAGEGKPIEVVRVEFLEADGSVGCDFLPVACQHCSDPLCSAACPRGAILRDGEGLIQVDEDRCIGCGLCAAACPYGAIHIRATEAEGKKAWKCDLCRRRRAMGLPTSCEQHCLGGAFRRCSRAELERLAAGRKYRWSAGQVVYVSDTVQSLGQGLEAVGEGAR